MLPARALRRRARAPEQSTARAAAISRVALRAVEQRSDSSRLSTLATVAEHFGRRLEITAVSDAASSDQSTVAVTYKILRDGFDSWRVHFMDLVDEFRRTLDGRLVSLPPPTYLDHRLRSLSASIVVALCTEAFIDSPTWARRIHWLDQPWFVSGSAALKATAILEAPLSFRRNNIFVLANFLERV